MNTVAVLVRYPGKLGEGFEKLESICGDSDFVEETGAIMQSVGYVFGSADYLVWLYTPHWASVDKAVESINITLNNLLGDDHPGRAISSTFISSDSKPDAQRFDDLVKYVQGTGNGSPQTSNQIRANLAYSEYIQDIAGRLSKILKEHDSRLFTKAALDAIVELNAELHPKKEPKIIVSASSQNQSKPLTKPEA